MKTAARAIEEEGEGPRLRPVERHLPEATRDVLQPDGLEQLDRDLVALCGERGQLRAALARIASRIVGLDTWERLGFARLSDYAAECFGLSSRWVQGLARVGQRFRDRPALETALVSGALGWTKVRLLASLPLAEDEARWIAFAGGVTAEQLSRSVRKVDRGSLEGGALDDEAGARSRVFEVPCDPEVRRKWYQAKVAAGRVAGRMLSYPEAAELIAAEVLSALPVDASDSEPSVAPADPAGGDPVVPSPAEAGAHRRRRFAPWPGTRALAALVDGLDEADAFDLDERFRRVLAMEQRLDARIGPLLALVWRAGAHRALGFRTREAYARERLGMDPTRARALVRLERATVLSASFDRAYRSGALSMVKAGILVPLVTSDSLGRFAEGWVAWAGRVTVRRLREDVESALTLQETDPEAFGERGGFPSEADREIGASPSERQGSHRPTPDREIRAGWSVSGGSPVSGEVCSVRFFGPADIVQLLRAVLCTVRRRIERETGRLTTPGEALGAMMDHALASWTEQNGKVPARHRVFERDGWRCSAPGCTSMRNLHDHHVRFRSAGGSNAPENRVTLCAFHHLRGVHGGRLRCVGRAPDGLTWQIGIRPGVSPRFVYRSGDVLRSPFTPPSWLLRTGSR